MSTKKAPHKPADSKTLNRLARKYGVNLSKIALADFAIFHHSDAWLAEILIGAIAMPAKNRRLATRTLNAIAPRFGSALLRVAAGIAKRNPEAVAS